METYMVQILRVALCFAAVVAGVRLMCVMESHKILRRLSCILAIVVILMNEVLAEILYVTLSSLFQTFLTVVVFGLIFALSIVIMVLPVAWLVHYIFHS